MDFVELNEPFLGVVPQKFWTFSAYLDLDGFMRVIQLASLHSQRRTGHELGDLSFESPHSSLASPPSPSPPSVSPSPTASILWSETGPAPFANGRPEAKKLRAVSARPTD